MSPMIRIILSGALCLAVLDAAADVIPRLGDNIVRAGPLMSDEALRQNVPRAVPAIADLNLDSDDANFRRFAVAWIQQVTDEVSFDTYEVLFAAIVDAEGNPVAAPSRLARYRTDNLRPSNPAIAADSDGFFTVTWSVIEFDTSAGSRDFNQTIYARTFRPEPNAGTLCPADGMPVFLEDPPAMDAVLFDTALFPELGDVAGSFDLMAAQRISIDSDSSAAGRTVIVFPDHRAEPNWGVYAISTNLEVDEPPPDPSVWCEVDHARLALPDPLAPVTRITGQGESGVAPRVAINANNEQAVVVWRSQEGAIRAQRLSPSGSLRGDPIEVVSAPQTIQESVHDPDIDYGPDGFFRVVWEQSTYRRGDTPASSRILLSRFDDAGTPLEENQEIARDQGSEFSTMFSLRYPRVQTRELGGDFAVSWSKQRDECPRDFNLVENWAVVSTDPNCDLTGSSLVTDHEGVCDFEVISTQPRPEARCRMQVQLRELGPNTSGDGIVFVPDSPTRWDDFSTSKSFQIRFPSRPALNNRCIVLASQSPFGGRQVSIEQTCSNLPGFPCVTCAEQSAAFASELEVLDAGLGEDSLAGIAEPSAAPVGMGPAEYPRADASAPERAGVSTGADLRLRWFQSDYQSEAATPVEPITVNNLPLTAGAPALAMGRSGDMLIGWIAEDLPDPSGTGTLNHALLTQSLTGPVELSINDVGILEGPILRATANFTLTANKRYPVRPGECDESTPRPTVSLLTADGTASFLSGDYERTTGTLFFDPCDPLAPLSLGFPITVLDDNVFEDTESFFVDLFDEQNAIVVRRQGTGAIVDNDPPATVSVPPGIVEICEDGTEPAVDAPRCPGSGPPRSDVELRLRLNIAQEVEGSVEFLTLDGSPFGGVGAAFANSDYEPVAGELQFLPGTIDAFLSVDLIDDGFAELPEQFFVELTGADNLTLPDDPDDLRITVTIIDDDSCTTAPQWFLPDPTATAPDVLPTDGPEADRTGYFCIVNSAGIETCPWVSQLDLLPGEEPWLGRTDIPFSAPPAGVTPEDVQAAEVACALISGATGAIRYVAEENLPNPANPTVQSRTQGVLFVNGAAEPSVRDVTQAGGDCSPQVTPVLQRFFPVGGTATFEVSFGGEPACQFSEWTAQVDSSAADWLSIDGASADTGRFTFNGPGAFTIEVDPYLPETGPVFDRIGVINVGDGVQVIQEAPLFDHFDDGVPPDPAGWQYLEPDSWTETGTHLSASTMGLARVIADPAFAGCSRCIVETTVRFDQFSKGRAIVYLWWRDPNNHLRLVADEFFDSWTLVQRINGTDRIRREFSADILVGQEYPVRIEYRDDLGAPLITVDVDGQAMCPTPGPGVQPCTPWDPDPDNPAVPPVVGSGVVGLAVEETGASFNRLRVIRSDELPFPLSVLFADDFETQR